MIKNLTVYLIAIFLLVTENFSAREISGFSFAKVRKKSLLSQNQKYEVIGDRSTLLKSTGKISTLKIRLPNGIQVFLISDPSLSECAASVCVEAGTWDDPDEHPGMAHFVEHLLFLGTENYPKESDYSQYILERGGQYNAFTRQDRTTYGFSIHPEGFKGALDRLSCFFLNPLFTQSAIEREMHAVHHEFEDSIENDSVRIWRVLKETGNPKHPNFNFSCGNLKSLSKVMQKDVVKWFEKYYQPKHMKLVLMSQEPLEEIAKLASTFFSRIPQREEENFSRKKEVEHSMTSPKQLGHLICVKPAFKNRTLSLMWEVPKLFLDYENSRAMHLLQMALDHGYSNSLSKVLERESLAKEVHVDFWKVEKNHALFMIHVHLTDQGVRRYEEVVNCCFQAITSLKQLGIPNYLLEQLSYLELSQLTSGFTNSFDYIMKISSELVDEEIETYPDKTYLPAESSCAKATALLSELIPSQCLYFLTAPPEEVGVHLSHIERWMGAEYVMRKISQKLLDEWSAVSAHPSIGLQPEEKLRPREKDAPVNETEIPVEDVPDPVFILDDETARIRLMESSSNEDSVDAFFCIISPLIGSSAKNKALNEVFVRGLRDLLEISFADQKNIFWDIEIDENDFCVFLSVPKNAFQRLFAQFFSVLKNYSISPFAFERIKKKKLDSYPGDPQPIEYAHQILDSLLKPFSYTEMELYHNLVELTYDEYEQFRSSYFKQIFVEGAFLGSLDKDQSLRLWQTIASILKPIPYINHNDKPRSLLFSEEEQSYFVVQKTHRKGNALVLLIDAGDSSEENWLVNKLVSVVLQNEFFEELRTRQQTAYKVYSWNERMDQKICHCFGLQSSTYHPFDLLKRVESFLDGLSSRFYSILTSSRFELIRNTFLFNLENRRGRLDKVEDIEFLNNQINIIENLQYEKVLQDLSIVFSKNNRRRIAVLVEGNESFLSHEEDLYKIPYLPIKKEMFHR